MNTPYIIAEIGSVHDGSFGNACRLIEAAAGCGANAVKFQTHLAEAESLADAPAPGYFSTEPRVSYFRRTAFSIEQYRALASTARGAGVDFLSSPFSLQAVDMLEKIDMPAYKIPSGEVTNLPLLEKVARTGKKVYLSSGMSTWAELDAAVASLRGASEIVVLQCTTSYPCAPEHVGLNVMVEMRARYATRVGLSDHTLGCAAAAAAVTLGATVVEKHFTFSRLMYGSDAKHSMEPADFTRFCDELREIATIMASPVDKNDVAPLQEMKRIFEKSIVTAVPLPTGTTLAFEHLAFKKPGDGISAARFRELLGRKIARDLGADHKLSLQDLM